MDLVVYLWLWDAKMVLGWGHTRSRIISVLTVAIVFDTALLGYLVAQEYQSDHYEAILPIPFMLLAKIALFSLMLAHTLA